MTSTAQTQAGEGASTEGGHDDPILGKVIDGCRIQRKLGQGGMGVVYLADHDSLHQPFVIKILNPALVGAEDTVERFFREAQACAQLNHSGIVAIQNVGQEGEYYFIRMEYIEGKTLEDTIRAENQMDWKRSVSIIVDTADALAHAHQKGMIHRDIKPENIMLTPEGQVKVMDFGLAKHVHSNAKVSVTGQIVGTPFFMSPEQAGGKPTDARSDIYSLGVTLYYMLTGVKPFNGKNLQEIFLKHFFYAPESPKVYNGELPESLCEVVKKCLKKKKKERYQSAKELVRDLRAVLMDPDAVVATEESASESQEGAVAPEGGVGDDFGKTIRAKAEDIGDKTQVGGGTAVVAGEDVGGQTVRANAGGDQTGGDGDRTVRVDEDAGGRTVRVEEDEGGATVRVGDTSSDNSATVVKKPPKRAGGVSGGSSVATISFQDGKSVVVNTQIDADHPAAGLDFGTAVLEAGAKVEPGPPRTGGRAAPNRTKMLVVGALVLAPIGGLVVVELFKQREIAALTDEYNKVTPGDVVMSQDPADLDGLADRMEAAKGGLSTDRVVLEGMINRLREYARTIRDKRETEKAAEADRERRAKVERERALRREKLEKEAAGRQAKLEGLRTGGQWSDYATEALAFVAEYQEDLPSAVTDVRIPVRITSEPPGAQLFLNESLDPNPEQTPGIAWVPPNKVFKIRVVKRGFKEEVVSAPASGFIEEHKELFRKEVRTFVLGEWPRMIGNKNLPAPVLPSSEPALDIAGGGVIYLVGDDGLARATSLKRGLNEWTRSEKDHRIGIVGDPTPSPFIVPGQLVLMGSMLGTLSAHRPTQQGQQIWRVVVGSAVTSQPTYGQAPGGQRVAAAGTQSGEVVFVDTRTEQVVWRFLTHNQVVSPPLLQGERAFVGSTDNRVYALDWVKKEKLGELDLGDDVVCGPLALGRKLVVGTRSGAVHVIDAADPAAMLRKSVLNASGGGLRREQGLLVDADRIYVSAGREVRAYAVAQTGAARDAWAAPFEAPAIVTRPFVSNDTIYVGGENGVVYALDRGSGQLLWKHVLGGSGAGSSTISWAPFVVEAELFVICGNRVVVLEAD